MVAESAQSFCTNCGAEVHSSQTYCTHCGTRIHFLVASSVISGDPFAEAYQASETSNVCQNCGEELSTGDHFCTSCGFRRPAPVSNDSAPSGNEAWRALLLPGEVPVLIIDNPVLRVPVQYKSSLVFKRWRLVRTDKIMLTNLRLFFIKAGKILKIRQVNVHDSIHETSLRRTTSFTIDPSVVQLMISLDKRRQKERLEKLVHTSVTESLKNFYAGTALGICDEEERLRAVTSQWSEFPPLVWVWSKQHRVRPIMSYRAIVWLFWGGLIVSVLTSFFLCSVPFVIFMVLCGSAWLVSLPFRLKPWKGIMVSQQASTKRPFQLQAVEIAIFENTRAEKLWQLLEPASAKIREILEHEGRLGDRVGFSILARELRGLREAIKNKNRQ